MTNKTYKPLRRIAAIALLAGVSLCVARDSLDFKGLEARVKRETSPFDLSNEIHPTDPKEIIRNRYDPDRSAFRYKLPVGENGRVHVRITPKK